MTYLSELRARVLKEILSWFLFRNTNRLLRKAVGFKFMSLGAYKSESLKDKIEKLAKKTAEKVDKAEVVKPRVKRKK